MKSRGTRVYGIFASVANAVAAESAALLHTNNCANAVAKFMFIENIYLGTVLMVRQKLFKYKSF